MCRDRTPDAGRVAMFLMLAVVTMTGMPDNALAQTIGGMAKNVDGNFNSIVRMLMGLSYLLGFVAVGAGLMKLKQASDGHVSGAHSYAPGLWYIAAGAGLVALPSVMVVGCGTFFGAATCSATFSVTSGLGGGGGKTLGDLVVTVSKDIVPNIGGVLLVGASALGGVYLTFRGLLCLRDAAGGGASHGNLRTSDGLVRIFCGALLWELPKLFGVGLDTFFGSSSSMALSGTSAGATSDCTASGGGITCVANNLASNLAPVFIQASFVFMFVIGAWMLFHAIWKLAEAHESGNPQVFRFKEGGHGYMSKFAIAILLLNMPKVLEAVADTFGISDGTISASGGFNSGSSLLAYSAPSGAAAVLASYAGMIQSCLTILAMFGVLAVWRGVRLWVQYAEGDRQTLFPGTVHVIGGALLTNAKWSFCTILTTVIGNGMGFC